jgi:hypothetical protein
VVVHIAEVAEKMFEAVLSQKEFLKLELVADMVDVLEVRKDGFVVGNRRHEREQHYLVEAGSFVVRLTEEDRHLVLKQLVGIFFNVL